MSPKNIIASTQETLEKVEEIKNSKGADKLVGIAEKLSGKEKLSLQKKAEHALELKETTSKSFIEKANLKEEITDSFNGKSLLKKGMTAGLTSGFGLLLGKGKENKELAQNASEAMGEVTEIVTDEKELHEVNNTIRTAIETERKVEEVEAKVNQKWGFEKEKKGKNWIKELEKKETKYKKYNTIDAIKEAWDKTEFEVDNKTGNKTKRNFFFRLFAFFPSLTKTLSSWRSFEALKKSGAIDKLKRTQEAKEKADKKIKEAEGKIEKGLEAKKEAFSSVFEENPGAVNISKDYFKKLMHLTRNADKYTSAERADLIRKYAKEAATKGTKQFGPEFAKMKGFEKYMPGVSIKTRGGLILVEVVGKSLGSALREGADEGGWARATDVFKEELMDMENWKDAAPGLGTWRSGERLFHDDDIPMWSKWADFGISLGMDVATAVAIWGSLGTATGAAIAARTAGGAAVRSSLRKLATKQMMKQGARGGKKFIQKEFSKEGRKKFTKRAIQTAGGKWSFKVNLMLTTIGEFFGGEIEESKAEAKVRARDLLLTTEQKRALLLMKAAETGGELPPDQEDQGKK